LPLDLRREATLCAFVEGSALDLPVSRTRASTCVLNVEASNDYGDRPRFFSEVARVLRPDGVFLYTDSFRPPTPKR
jgi:ubiquinone/menaquinone biosynthesis C-methylase UbiE